MNDEPPKNEKLPLEVVLQLAAEHVKGLQRMVDKRDEIIREGTRQYRSLEIKHSGVLGQIEQLKEKNKKLIARNTKLLEENDKLLQGIIKELRRDEEIIKLKNKINELRQ